ncbi:hypothetical protein I862_03520 [endosymbiont of Acanthamoeba sp. UWC8]|uniref:DUF721 domain-containing protein n=1 Tax=endosymbiont of Acanthamoeba sp. UWC8 TaxID=86106 RepID=UPI0004D1B9F9|nr:DUF721 domain-containing protein [endosymbiont of Acanthamoeba sp. UWC8]AIF81264.1 hypothetical protein I862_03520 [endosymbiont of Acanthamoeba sp. UWC8]
MQKISAPKKLINIIEEVTKPICKQYGFINFKITANWQQIVGVRIAQICSPVVVKFQGEENINGILTIGVENPGFGLEIQANSNIIVEKIATYFGYRAVDKIKLQIIPKRKKKDASLNTLQPKKPGVINSTMTNALAEIEDPEIKEIFQSIAEQIS